MKVPVEKFKSHPLNPRLEFNELVPPPGEDVPPSTAPTMTRLQSLAQSIKQSGGHPINPIIVRPITDGYEIISGHTRFKALTQILGYKELEENVDFVVREMDDNTAIFMMVDDNLRRWHYSVGELARAFKLLVENLGMSEHEIARQYNVDRAWVTRIHQLNRLPTRVLNKVVIGKGHAFSDGNNNADGKGAITIKHAVELTKLTTNDQKEKVARAIERHNLTAKETSQVVQLLKVDPWRPVDDVVSAVRMNAISNSVSSLVVELRDSRVAEALSRAANENGISAEEYASRKIVEGLVNDGYLRPSILEQIEYAKWYEENGRA